MGFRGDERGQSEVIGALLIFAVIVAFIGLNQAFLVPQANEDVEFKHNNDVQRDLVDLRAAITEAAASNQPRSRSIELGTDYPSRFVAINPPPATGTIRTVDGDGGIDADHEDLDLSAVCGTSTDEPETKFITYRPNYNEHQNALPTTVENTVAYRATNSDPLYSTGQMFAQGRQINIIRYVGDVSDTASGTASLDLVPSETGVDTVDTSNETLNVTLPTRLSASDWGDLVDTSQVTPHDVPGEDRVEFGFANDTTYTVRCTTVGVNEEPDVEPRVLNDEEAEEKFDAINPASEGSILLSSTSDFTGSGASEVSIWLENRSNAEETVSIERARLNYFSGTSPGHSPENGVTHLKFTQSGSTKFVAGGELKSLDDPIELETDDTDVQLEFDGQVQGDDFYVLTIEFSDGNVGTYFVSHSKTDDS